MVLMVDIEVTADKFDGIDGWKKIFELIWASSRGE